MVKAYLFNNCISRSISSLLAILVFCVAMGCSHDHRKDVMEHFGIPPEWEEHEAIWFGWENYETDYHPVVANIILALEDRVKIKLALESDSIKRVAGFTLDSLGVDTAIIEFHVVQNDLFWIRDNGALFTIDSNQKLSIIDFTWAAYGYPDWYNQRNVVSTEDFQKWKKAIRQSNRAKVDSMMGVITKSSYQKSDIAIEGGGFEYNGNGVLIQCEAVTLQRNPRKTKHQIELLYEKLGVEKVIWLPKGLVEDEHIVQLFEKKYVTGGTGGHTDEFVRFANENTILLAWIFEDEIDAHPLNRINHLRMSKNLEILQKATDTNGKPFTIIKVPLPHPIEKKAVVVEKGKRDSGYPINYFLPEDSVAIGDSVIAIAASSYLNFLVTNGTVLLGQYAQYGSANKDESVQKIFEQLYPNREIVMLDVLPLNEDGGGGIHCSTMQEPKVK